MEIQSDASETKNKILTAALNLFSENGFHATTTKVIAQLAGVNEVTLFRLFKTKNQLFTEILEHAKRAGFDSQRVEGLNLGPEEAIRYVIAAYLETLEDHPKEFKIMYHAILDEVKEFEQEFIQGHQAKLLEFLTKTFIDLKKEAGEEPRKNPRLHAQMLISTLLGVATGRILAPNLPIRNYSRKELCDYVADLYLHSI